MEYVKSTYAKEIKPVQQTQSYAGSNQKRLPDKKFRAGAISVTIWSNPIKDKSGNATEYMTISLERNYLDKSGKWQSTSSMRANDLPRAALLLNKAFEYIVLKQSSYETSRVSEAARENIIIDEE